MNSPTHTVTNGNMNSVANKLGELSFYLQHKFAILSFVGMLLFSILGFGIYKTFSEKSQDRFNSKIHTFENTFLKDYQANPTSEKLAKDLVVNLESLHKEMGNYPGLLLIALKASDSLVEGNFYSQARDVLKIARATSHNDYSDYFVLNREAALLEDMGEIQLAISTLLKMTSESVKVFEGKIYLDLGRLYLKIGDKKKAREQFQYVVEKTKDEIEFVKIAELFLAKL